MPCFFLPEEKAALEGGERERAGEGAGERERGEVKMQFETLRQFCSSVLSHFNGAFTPQSILETELAEQERSAG